MTRLRVTRQIKKAAVASASESLPGWNYNHMLSFSTLVYNHAHGNNKITARRGGPAAVTHGLVLVKKSSPCMTLHAKVDRTCGSTQLVARYDPAADGDTNTRTCSLNPTSIFFRGKIFGRILYYSTSSVHKYYEMF